MQEQVQAVSTSANSSQLDFDSEPLTLEREDVTTARRRGTSDDTQVITPSSVDSNRRLTDRLDPRALQDCTCQCSIHLPLLLSSRHSVTPCMGPPVTLHLLAPEACRLRVNPFKARSCDTRCAFAAPLA